MTIQKSFDNIRDFLSDGEFGCLLITSRHTASDLLVSDLDSAIELERPARRRSSRFALEN